jgi:hypothetical protein
MLEYKDTLLQLLEKARRSEATVITADQISRAADVRAAITMAEIIIERIAKPPSDFLRHGHVPRRLLRRSDGAV